MPSRGRDGLLHPPSEDELATWVQEARRAAARLRVVGAGHSVAAAIGDRARAPAATGTEWLVSLDRLAAIEIDASARRASVEGGARLGADPADLRRQLTAERGLCARLEAVQLALNVLGGISGQTLAGFLATGSAGGSLRYALTDRVRGLRLVDGRGTVRELTRDTEPGVDAATVSLGLLGVVTRVDLDVEESFDVQGEEQALAERDWDVDLEARGARGLEAFLRDHDYARVVWFPQPGVRRLLVWRGRRVPRRDGTPGESYRPFFTLAGSDLPAQALARYALSWTGRRAWCLPEPTLLDRGIYRLFLGGAPRRFRDRWHRVLPMDDAVDERWLPVEFSEIWLPLERAHEALRRLRAHFAAGGYATAGNFALELYGAPASSCWLSPGHGRDSLRLNVFWFEPAPAWPRARHFAQFLELFSDLSPRVHWGKHLPGDPRRSATIARALPRYPEFLELRRAWDPDGVFLTRYWAEHLGIEARASCPPPNVVTAPRDRPEPILGQLRAPRVPPSSGRFPLLFPMRAVDAEFAVSAEHRFDNRALVRAPPEVVYGSLVGMAEATHWVEHFRRVDWLTPLAPAEDQVFDESFSFMTVRVRNLVADPGKRWMACVDAASLPLASAMLELATFAPTRDGNTRFRWVVYYDLNPATRALHPLLRPLFARLFRRSTARLAALYAAGG